MLSLIDIVVLVVYLASVVGLGCWFVRRSRNTGEFMAAGGRLPGWAVGLSIFGTYLSSNTFIGVPGKSFAGNWNAFVFSLSLPLAAWIATRFFVPFYRKNGEISAYQHLERRFGAWARTYAMVCYLLTQVARTATILFGVSLALTALTGWPQPLVILIAGFVVTLYTLLGGIEAVIWTDVIQSVVLTIGAIVVVFALVMGVPGGWGEIHSIAQSHDKLSLGSMGWSLSTSTFWVVLIYGIFINLNNFGIDQSFVQRYQTAKSDSAANRSVWMGAWLYLPISAVFFFIGTGLFAYYETRPEDIAELKLQVAAKQLAEEVRRPLGELNASDIQARANELKVEDLGDRVFPFFLVNVLPVGMTGLLIAALVAAAMSSIDTSLNSSATVLLTDFYQRFLRPNAGERESMIILYGATLLVGVAGTTAALAMLGIDSILDAWWSLSGMFAGGMLGLFLLGVFARSSTGRGAIVGVASGVAVIAWMTFSPVLDLPEGLKNHLHTNLTIVIGTLTIFTIGVVASRLMRRDPTR